jgi:3-isopropylmalate dehydrogenase
MRQKDTIALLPGDGIGPEVIKEAVKVLRSLGKSLGIELTLNEVPVGGAA